MGKHIAVWALAVAIVPVLGRAAEVTREWACVVRGDAPAATFAAEELRKYLKQMAGIELSDKPDAWRTIVLGRRDQLTRDEQGQLAVGMAVGFDGYAVSVREGRIIIAGENELGVCYGVYDLLERLGCRWFYSQQDAKDQEVVPKLEKIIFREEDWFVASPFKHRIYNGDEFYFEMKKEPAIAQVDHALKTRHNMIGWQQGTKETIEQQYEQMERDGILKEIRRRGMTMHGPAHSFDRLLRWEDYGQQHPEWFGLRDGKRVPQTFAGAQFCWSNAEARTAFSENVEKLAGKMPLISIFCIIPFDGGVACACDACKKAGGPSNLLMVVMGEVIERLGKFHPEMLVETVGGYGPVKDPPAEVKINPKQRVVWAHWGRYHAVGYDDAKYDRTNLEAWHRAARGGLTVCNYYSDNFSEPWVMQPFTVAMESDRRYLMKQKIESVYFLIWPPGFWWNHSLNTYLGGRSYFDASQSPRELLRDYAIHYYGPAGELMADYWCAWADDPDLGYRVRGNAKPEDPKTLAEMRERFLAPAEASVKDDPVFAYRLSKVEGLHRLAERLCHARRMREDVIAARKSGDPGRASKLLDEADIYTDAIMGLFYELSDRNAGLIDRNEIPSFIKTGVKNWIAEERAAMDRK